MMSNEIFLLYSNCIIVKGYKRSVICDLQRKKTFLVPLALASLFINGNEFHYNEIEQQLPTDEIPILKEYLQFLQSNDLVFLSTIDSTINFPQLSKEWDYPALITNCIVDAKDEILFFDKSFVRQLDALGCYHLQFRFYGSPEILHLKYLIDQINDSEIQSLELSLCNLKDESYSNRILSLRIGQGKIKSIILHSSAVNKILQEPTHNLALVIASKEKVASEKCCGIVDQGYFQANVSSFTESLAHNTCLNRKVSIDVDGNIKNCPSMKESFGNIKDTTLEEAINKPGFKKYWNITKDEITKCKDCEFRHICTDCRVYLENPEDMYSAPLKCGYDPYTCEWEEWSTNPLKEKAIEYYAIQELIKK